MDKNEYWEFFSSTGQIDFYLKMKEMKGNGDEGIIETSGPHEGDSNSLQ